MINFQMSFGKIKAPVLSHGLVRLGYNKLGNCKECDNPEENVEKTNIINDWSFKSCPCSINLLEHNTQWEPKWVLPWQKEVNFMAEWATVL